MAGKMSFTDQVDALEDLAMQYGDLREDYSGRGMHGKQCYGIVTDRPMRLIEDAGEAGIKGAVMDSMGLDTIVYWPHISAPVPA